MSVFIKGMDMPKCCDDCKLNYDCFCAITGHNFYIINEDFDSTKERAFDCPLEEISTHHGRLVDVNNIITVLASWIHSEEVLDWFIKEIEYVPTIIEEE